MFEKLRYIKEPSKCMHGIVLDFETKIVGDKEVKVKDPKKCKDCKKAQDKLIKRGRANG